MMTEVSEDFPISATQEKTTFKGKRLCCCLQNLARACVYVHAHLHSLRLLTVKVLTFALGWLPHQTPTCPQFKVPLLSCVAFSWVTVMFPCWCFCNHSSQTGLFFPNIFLPLWRRALVCVSCFSSGALFSAEMWVGLDNGVLTIGLPR